MTVSLSRVSSHRLDHLSTRARTLSQNRKTTAMSAELLAQFEKHPAPTLAMASAYRSDAADMEEIADILAELSKKKRGQS